MRAWNASVGEHELWRARKEMSTVFNTLTATGLKSLVLLLLLLMMLLLLLLLLLLFKAHPRPMAIDKSVLKWTCG